MEFIGKITGMQRHPIEKYFTLSLRTTEDIADEINRLVKRNKLRFRITNYHGLRSGNANRMLWGILGQMAGVLGTDKWSLYLQMLRKYGKYTYVLCKPQAVDDMMKLWRESEKIGKVNVNGEEAVQLLCYFGSSTYDAQEFSVLLNGVISEAKELGIKPPPPEEVERTLEHWEKSNQ